MIFVRERERERERILFIHSVGYDKYCSPLFASSFGRDDLEIEDNISELRGHCVRWCQ